jgi:hypothetical protein
VSGGLKENIGRQIPRPFEANSEPVSQIMLLFISFITVKNVYVTLCREKKKLRKHQLSRCRDYATGWMSKDLHTDFRQGQEVFLFSKS